ncbi:hypothetical protein NQ317_008903 [Molorchus minor]|uniref:Uncharacterized protein n=1 Tax=Molorchus minor TaxID=1323400 RepID=A0ABQ9IXA7_9CUCU|nr:hypothetical protein NQ317_008903 [Molorchus minor]
MAYVQYTLLPGGKDIRRFLWCLSILNYKNLGTSNIRNIIIPSIMRMLKAEEFEDTFALTDIILCLWILNYRAYELIQNALTKKTIQLIKASKSPAKHSLNLLLSCIYFEDKALYRQINIHVPENPKYDTKLEVKKALSALKNFEKLETINEIAGITGYRKGIYPSIYIEVLDDCTSLKNTDHEPIGLMQLKLRILQEMKERLIVIQEKKINLMNDDHLRSYLQDEINTKR